MAYRKPGVTATQEYTESAASVVPENLKGGYVGPAYQLVDNDSLGLYEGNTSLFSYNELIGGSIVDLEKLSPDEQFPVTKKPVSAKLMSALVEVAAEAGDGVANGTNFVDSVTASFTNAAVGDLVKIVPKTGLTIVATQTGGSIPNVVGQLNRLTKVGAFSKVKVGDIVNVISGTNANIGNYPVTAVISDDMVVVFGNINDGVAATIDASFDVVGDRGVENQGSYRIKTKTSNNAVVLETVLPLDESLVSYSVVRSIPSIDLLRVDSLTENGFVAEAAGISLPSSSILQFEGKAIVGGTVYASYRALRLDFAGEIKKVADPNAIDALFGPNQIHPANPLAYALHVGFLNTSSPLYILGLGADAAVDEAIAYNKCFAKLSLQRIYALAPLTQNSIVHMAYNNHVTQLSDKKKFRIAFVNSKLIKTLTLASQETTVATLSGSRTIVGTSIDASANIVTPTQLVDSTPNKFLNVRAGDKVSILAGTNSVVGTYNVVSKPNNNTLILSGNIISSGSSTDFSYVVQRLDGIEADGSKLYDRNASFITNGIAAGHYVKISSPAGVVGRFKVGSVLSEKELTFQENIAGVITHQSGVVYLVERDLSSTEMAETVRGYSEGFANRRLIHCWPDVLKQPVGSQVQDVPGFYNCVKAVALCAGLPPQQGFTNLSVAGSLGYEHSLGFFSEDELDIVADGGTMIFVQDGEGEPLYIRHQLSTDRSSIKFQEVSFTKNVDFCCYYLMDGHKDYIGQYNITDALIQELSITAGSLLKYLKETTKRPKIGANLRDGKLLSINESETNIDTIGEIYALSIPVPLNYLDIIVRV